MVAQERFDPPCASPLLAMSEGLAVGYDGGESDSVRQSVSDNKLGPPRPTIAPEFAGRGGLAAALKPTRPPSNERNESHPAPVASEADHWTVFGVGAIWQTAAENAARLSGHDLGQWLALTIEEAAADQGIVKSSGGS